MKSALHIFAKIILSFAVFLVAMVGEVILGELFGMRFRGIIGVFIFVLLMVIWRKKSQEKLKRAFHRDHKGKWIVLALVFLIALLVLGGSILLPDEEIALIKTDKNSEFSEQVDNLYRNTKYGFRIKFPEGWEVRPGDGPNIVQKAVRDGHTISIGVRELPTEFGDKTLTVKDLYTFQEFKSELTEVTQEAFPGAEIIDSGETKIDNIPTYWIKHSMPYSALDVTVEGINLQYQVLYKNVFYFISAGAPIGEFDLAEPEFKKSISTFVFEDY